MYSNILLEFFTLGLPVSLTFLISLCFNNSIYNAHVRILKERISKIIKDLVNF